MAQDPEGPPPEPPPWAGAGVPEPINDGPTKVDGYQTILVHDERAFMQECADRLNAFIHTHPDEAQHVLNTYVAYQHELVAVHEGLRRARHLPVPGPLPAGARVAHLICAILQTHQPGSSGFVLRPLILPDPDRGVGRSRIVKFTIERQEDLDDEPRV